MKVAAVILSGGASRRMGTPKALLEFAGETFLNRLIGLFEQHCAQVIVVLGYDAERIRAGAKST
ncbi:MAG: NTP transferase domain-containing protein, partial [Bryobacteraceae bacterium]|nr:NTP transferase domain-containing protein [Bryobacteraceae bacterium]